MANIIQCLHASAYRQKQGIQGAKKSCAKFNKKMIVFLNDKLRNTIKIHSVFFDLEKNTLFLYTARFNRADNMIEENRISIRYERGIVEIKPQGPLPVGITNSIKIALQMYSIPHSMLPQWVNDAIDFTHEGIFPVINGNAIEYKGQRIDPMPSQASLESERAIRKRPIPERNALTSRQKQIIMRAIERRMEENGGHL